MNIHIRKQLSVIAITTVVALCGSSFNALAATHDSKISEVLQGENLSSEELAEFEKYLEKEELFEETVVTAPSIVTEPLLVDETPLDIEIDNPASDKQLIESFLRNGSTDISVQTLNPTETRDNRIGAIYWDANFQAHRGCTASHIGGKFWLTAHHCVAENMDDIGFIEQSDGDFAGIEAIYTKSSNYDIALIKVGSGIKSETFDLSSSTAPIGTVLSVVGYAKGNNFASKSTMAVTQYLQDITYLGYDYHYFDILGVTPVTPHKYWPAKGDSGSAGWVGNTIYSVLSGVGSIGVMANTAPHVDWIRETMQKNSRSSIAEKFRAFRGGIASNYPHTARTTLLSGGSSFGSSR